MVTVRTHLLEAVEVVGKEVANPTKVSCFYRMKTVRVVRTATCHLGAEIQVVVISVIILQAGGTTTTIIIIIIIITPQVSLITIQVSTITIAMPVVEQVVSLAASVVPSTRWSLKKIQGLMRVAVFCRHQDWWSKNSVGVKCLSKWRLTTKVHPS
jgi:hypothetical protein